MGPNLLFLYLERSKWITLNALVKIYKCTKTYHQNSSFLSIYYRIRFWRARDADIFFACVNEVNNSQWFKRQLWSPAFSYGADLFSYPNTKTLQIHSSQIK